MRRATLSLLAAVPLALAAIPAVAFAGPPWISIELPANPYDRATKGAFLVVHAFHHGTPMGFPVTGKAEGIVNGQRKSVDLKFERTERDGAYVLKNQWGTEGEWTLVISVTQGENDKVTALVQVSGAEVFSVKVPTERRGEWDIPKKVTMADVEATLKDRTTRVALRP
jgi:hypothetical protein